MSLAGASPDHVMPPVAEDPSYDVVSLIIDADWRATGLIDLISALEKVYSVFLAVELDRQTGGGNLGAIASKLGDLAPDSALAIPSMHFASEGLVSLKGSGEIPREVRGFLADLETIGQRRKANRLDLRLKEQELEERTEENKIELAEHRRRLMQMDIEIASDHLALAVNYFEAKYGPDWRSVSGAQEQFDQFLAAGTKLLQDFQEERIALPDGGEPDTGDTEFIP